MMVNVETFRLRCHNCGEIFYAQRYQLDCDDCVPHWSLPIAAACFASLSTILVVAALIHVLMAW